MDITKTLTERIDIKKLNEFHRKLASEGKNAATKNKNDKTCISCERDIKTGDVSKCHMCKKPTHKSCVFKSMSDECLQRAIAKNKFTCEKSNPVFNDDVEEEATTLQRLAIMNEDISQKNGANGVNTPENNGSTENIHKDGNNSTMNENNPSEDLKCNKCSFIGTSEDLSRKHILEAHSVNLPFNVKYVLLILILRQI